MPELFPKVNFGRRKPMSISVNELRAQNQGGFFRARCARPVVLCADVDGTLLRSCEPDSLHITVIEERMAAECLTWLNYGHLLFATAADRPFIDFRAVSPMIDFAKRDRGLQRMQRFGFISNCGAMAGIYDANGNEDGRFSREYNISHGIEPHLWGPLQTSIREALSDLSPDHAGIPIRIEARPVPLDRRQERSFLTSRDIIPEGYPSDFCLAQVTVASFPPDGSNLEFMRRAMEIMEQDHPGLADQLAWSDGAGINIDICRKGVDKADGIKTVLSHWGISDGTIYGLGDGFSAAKDHSGNWIARGDIPMLDVPGLNAFVVNSRRDSLEGLFEYASEKGFPDRIYPAGPGPSATLAVMRAFNRYFETGFFPTSLMPRETIEPRKSNRLINHNPVVLVSSRHGDTSNVMTLAWVTPLSSEPKLVGISVGNTRFSHKLITESGEFAVNVPDLNLLNVVMNCGKTSGANVDKFEEYGLTPIYGERINAPLIGECSAHLECRVIDSLLTGDHTFFVGEVVAASSVNGFLGTDGVADLKRFPTLGHLGGEHFAAHQHI
jgi:flavin reductase (DIM6/NTAB) family NADH-FMN oxidoreductase RutF